MALFAGFSGYSGTVVHSSGCASASRTSRNTRSSCLLVVAQDLLGLLDRDVATTDERLGVELAHRALLLDEVVHERLGVRRVVALVVTAPAVADQVDDDVLVERLAVLERQPGHPDAGLGVVAVHVEDRRLHHPGDVGAVERRARRGRRGGEADLVVDDDVDRAAGAVAAQLGQVQGLGDHALAGERGVAVHQQRQHREVARRGPARPAWPGRCPRGPGRRSRGATGSPPPRR